MRVKERFGLLLVSLVAAAFAAVQIWLGIWRYDIYRAGVDDGIFTQVVLSIGGCFCAAAEGWANHLLVHWSPVLVLAYPFVRIFGDARGLIVLQALAVAATAFPLYAIAHRHVDEWRAGAVASVAMFYPVLWGQAFTDFHENAFVPVLSATLAWAVAARRWPAGALAAFALLLVKEDQAVLLLLAGIIAMIMAGRKDVALRRFGGALAAGAVVTGALYFGVVRAALHSNVSYSALGFFDWLAGPQPGSAGAASPERLTYLIWALLPLLFLPLRSRLFLFALPGLAEVLASHYHVMLVFQTHYSMVWSGYVLAAFADSLGRLVSEKPSFAIYAGAAAIVTSACVMRFHDPMSRGYYLYRRPDTHDALLNSVLNGLPAHIRASGTDEIYAHLAPRRLASLGMNGDYFVADAKHADPGGLWETRYKPMLDAALRTGTYRVVFARDGIIVARKVR